MDSQKQIYAIISDSIESAIDDDLADTNCPVGELAVDNALDQGHLRTNEAKVVRSSVHDHQSSHEPDSPSETAEDEDTAAVKNQTSKAAIFMLLGAVSMGSMNIVVKYASTETKLTVMQLGMFRGIIMSSFCYLHCKYSAIETGVP